ncbi:hypothetical protein [Thalassospira profundimaris]|uniref:hypothetical protein n=1 Tax=Thalassospira profundimaris TaxID=502049 RepID=UPI0002872D23|nr:hypothetical protein [Thalassospira profundimaris]EKF07947.1 hypothetical protein TH2_10604 [Thalassospira profundimaris WP0211]
MNIPNRIQIDDLSAMEVADIASLPVEQLIALQGEIAERLTITKLMKDRFDSALECRFSLQAREVRAALGKDTGTVRFNEGLAQVVADLPKKVAWDQSQLSQLVERMKAEGDDPAEYVDITIKVSERKYAAWPSHIRSAFEGARTVRVGKASYQLSLNDEVQS